MKILNKIHIFLKKLSPFWFVITITLFTYICFIPFMYLFQNYDMGNPDGITKISFIGKIVSASIFIPLVETFIFQYLIIELSRNVKLLKNNNFVVIIISAIIFGLSHNYSFLYIFYSFIIGLFLAYSYIIYKKKNFSPFLIVTLIHSLRNTITTIIISFF